MVEKINQELKQRVEELSYEDLKNEAEFLVHRTLKDIRDEVFDKEQLAQTIADNDGEESLKTLINDKT